MYDGEQKALAEAMEGFFVLSHFLRGAVGKVGEADLKIASYGNPMRGRSRLADVPPGGEAAGPSKGLTVRAG